MLKTTQNYSLDFKKSAVQKFLSRGGRSANDLADELGVSSQSLYLWRDQFAMVPDMKKSSSTKGRSVTEKLKAIFEHDSLPAEKRGEYLRKHGIHEENLQEWKKQIENAFSPGKPSSEEKQKLAADQKEIKQLKRDLLRKDKALAEVTALLILKKKADLLWGSEEDE